MALALLSIYRIVLAPFLGGACRFHPSCSVYMADAVRMHGLRSGIRLGVRRLMRCRPFGGHGIDPVPHP